MILNELNLRELRLSIAVVINIVRCFIPLSTKVTAMSFYSEDTEFAQILHSYQLLKYLID